MLVVMCYAITAHWFIRGAVTVHAAGLVGVKADKQQYHQCISNILAASCTSMDRTEQAYFMLLLCKVSLLYRCVKAPMLYSVQDIMSCD